MCITTGIRPLESTDGTGTFAAVWFTDPRPSSKSSDGQEYTGSYKVDLNTPLGGTYYHEKWVDHSKSIGSPYACAYSKTLPQEMHTCQNFGISKRISKGHYPPRMLISVKRSWGFHDEPGSIECLGREIFAKIWKGAFCSGIRACHNVACKKRKEAFKAVAPDCTWDALRDFILTCLGCRIPSGGWGLIQDIILPQRWNILRFRNEVPKYFCLDIRGVLGLCRWSERIARQDLQSLDYGVVPSRFRLDSVRSLKIWQTILSEYENDVLDISQKCHNKGICPNRLWNASYHNSNTSVGICHLGKAVLALEHALNRKEDHDDCTAQYCLRAHDNSTLAKQAHKCFNEYCGSDITFPTSSLNEASHNQDEHGWFNTAWNLRPSNVAPHVMGLTETNYMAISHVWADGTGVGLKTPGHVNPCLYEYFADIAKRLGCNGLWWDTISIPSERTARGAALERMLVNFEKARITLVHDEDLVNFPWREDGSPAIALVLSSWFTRGWTAAELWASRGHPVKVLFKNPDDPTGRKPLIKDLDDDVLAVDVGEWLQPQEGSPYTKHSCRDVLNPAGTIPMQGYIVAAEVMKRIRAPFHEEMGNSLLESKFSDLLNVLSRRTTSWEKDRMIIAGLMSHNKTSAGHQLINSNTPGPKITQLILERFGRIEATDLLHSEVPIATYGPWSWCPQSIFQFGQIYHSSAPSDESCFVSPTGSLSCSFKAYEVLEDDIIIPCGSHPAGRVRISVALSNRGNCLLLSTPSTQNYQLYILAQPVYVSWSGISCRWVGCVRLQSSPDLKLDDKVGKRRYFALSWPTEFTFGRDITHSGKPLPPLSYDAVSRALESTLWGLKDTYPQTIFQPRCSDWREKDTEEWGPQLICFYDWAHPDSMLPPPPYPSALLAWDFDKRENRVQESFFKLLRGFVNVSSITNGLVTLSWSFPFPHPSETPPELYESGDYDAPILTQFKSQFRIVPRIEIAGKSHDISLGKDTFNMSIKPLMGEKDGHKIIWPHETYRERVYSPGMQYLGNSIPFFIRV